MKPFDQVEYQKRVKETELGVHLARDCFRAFWVGGLICTFGQFLKVLFASLFSDEKMIGCLVSASLIALACLISGIGWFDSLAKFAGAGTLVPITGFANAVCSPALDSKNEGFVLGVGAKMFTIAGPVIVYGVSASVIYGLVYWITTLF